MKLTVLIPTVPEHLESSEKLFGRIHKLADQAQLEISIVMVSDNKSMTIGEKRNYLKSNIKTEYWTMIDADDNISDEYFMVIKQHLNKGYDLITYNTLANLDKKVGVISSCIDHEENEQFTPNEVTKRKPWHVNIWRTEAVKPAMFDPKKNYGEDKQFSDMACQMVDPENCYHIDREIHFYNHNSEKSQANKRLRNE